MTSLYGRTYLAGVWRRDGLRLLPEGSPGLAIGTAACLDAASLTFSPHFQYLTPWQGAQQARQYVGAAEAA